MAKLSQKSVKPGVYCVGRDVGGRKVFREFSATDLAGVVANTKAMIAAGYEPPLLLEHAIPGSDEGAPKQFSARDERAQQVEHGVGWATDVRIGSDGFLEPVFNVTDKKIAAGLKDGSIKFTSPEFRPTFTDGKGNDYRNIVAHFALTHKPRNPEQGPFVAEHEPALQFSMADLLEPIQMADDEDPKDDDKKPDADPPPAAKDPPENPDAPKDDAPAQDDQQFQAVVQHLASQAIPLPSDTDPDNFIERLLTALLVKEAHVKETEAKKAEEDEDDDPQEPIVEAKPLMQFSLVDVSADTFENKLLARVIKTEIDHLKALARRLPPAAAKRFFEHEAAIQFSADGDELPSFKLGQVLEILAETTPAAFWLTDEERAEQFSTQDHRDPEFFTKSDKLPSPEKAVETVAEAEANANKVWGHKTA